MYEPECRLVNHVALVQLDSVDTEPMGACNALTASSEGVRRGHVNGVGVAQSEPPWKCRRVLIQHRRIQHMSAPRKYDQEFRERAVRMYRERLAEPGESKRGARRHVGLLLDVNPETLRNWADERDRVESGRSPAPRSAESEEVRALRRRVAELERANEILKTSAAFFAQAELDRRLR
jgi:transposase